MPRPRALTLAETLISVVLVGTLLVAALYTAGDALHFRIASSDRFRAEMLCQDLMAEIIEKQYEDPDQSPLFGLESGESAPRTNFDDVDDFHNWAASPPQSRGDDPELPDLAGWERRVTVGFADPNDLNTAAGSDSGVKRIKVQVTIGGAEAASCLAIRTRAADKARP